MAKRKATDIPELNRSPKRFAQSPPTNTVSFIAIIHSLVNMRASQFPKQKLAQDLKKKAGDVHSVTELPGGDLKIRCRSETQFQKLLHVDLLADKPVNIKPYTPRRTQCKGVIYGIDLNTKMEDLINKLKDQNVLHAKRLSKGNTLTTSVMIVFKGLKLPETVQLSLHNIIVKPFYEAPRRCYQCQKFGHTKKVCKSDIVCPKCSGKHEYQNCTETKTTCANCKQNHSAGYKGCSAYKRAKTIEFIKADKGVSYAEAVKQARQTQKPTSKDKMTAQSEVENHAQETGTEQTDQIIMSKLEFLGFINIVINSVHNQRTTNRTKTDIISNIAHDFLNWKFTPKEIIEWGMNPKFTQKASTPTKISERLNTSI